MMMMAQMTLEVYILAKEKLSPILQEVVTITITTLTTLDQPHPPSAQSSSISLFFSSGVILVVLVLCNFTFSQLVFR